MAIKFKETQVIFKEAQVMSLQDVADHLRPARRWKACEVRDGNIVFEAADRSGEPKKGYVGPSGLAFVYDESKGGRGCPGTEPWEDQDVDWQDFFMYRACVWGKDAAGNPVMVHS